MSVLGYAVVSVAGTWMFATFTYNGDGLQNHRFQTAPMLLGLLFAALWLLWELSNGARSPRSCSAGSCSSRRWARASSTARWIVTGTAVEDGRHAQGFPGRDRFYYTDRRSAVGAQTVYTKTKTAYVDPAVLYLYAGCRPAPRSGPLQNMDGHDLKEGVAQFGMGAFVEVSTIATLPRRGRGSAGRLYAGDSPDRSRVPVREEPRRLPQRRHGRRHLLDVTRRPHELLAGHH